MARLLTAIIVLAAVLFIFARIRNTLKGATQSGKGCSSCGCGSKKAPFTQIRGSAKEAQIEDDV